MPYNTQDVVKRHQSNYMLNPGLTIVSTVDLGNGQWKHTDSNGQDHYVNDFHNATQGKQYNDPYKQLTPEQVQALAPEMQPNTSVGVSGAPVQPAVPAQPVAASPNMSDDEAAELKKQIMAKRQAQQQQEAQMYYKSSQGTVR